MESIPLSWAKGVLRLSLYATASSLPPYYVSKEPNGADPKGPGRDPRFRKLVEGILFSRRFIPSYNLVLLGILLCFTAWHWGEKFAASRRRVMQEASGKSRKDDAAEDMNEAWSSSSSTIEGTATPPSTSKIPPPPSDETSPLLATDRSRRRATLGIKKPYFIIKAWLQHQPRPLPVINKTLPPNSVSLFVVAFIALNFFYNFYAMPLEIEYIFVFADRCGILFVANLPILYLLAAKNQPIKFLTGYSYESLNIFHRRVGELLCFEAFLHFVGMMFVWYGLLRRLGFTLMKFLFNRIILLGLGALIAYELLYFTSLGSFRQRCYEIFLATHVFLQIAALVFVWFHHHTSRPYVGVSLAIFVIDRLVYRLLLKSSSHPGTLSVLPDQETVLLSANWDVEPPNSLLRPGSMKNGWKPNDHVFITIPSLSHKHVLQAHPFTIFSASQGPEAGPEHGLSVTGQQHAWFSLLIRAQSDAGFTRTLLEHARSQPNVRVRLDGPYGSSHALDILEDSETAIVIAGGSGIAVAYPLLWALLHPTTDLESGRRKLRRKVRLLWAVHATSHGSWVPQDKMAELEEWGLEVLIPAATSDVGRPDVGKIVNGWMGSHRTGVVVSGPDGLVRDVRNTCAALVADGADVRVQVEKFGW